MTRDAFPVARERAQELALWRYHLIAEALQPHLSKAARGRIVRCLAGREHTDPQGELRRISVNTLYRWIEGYRKHRLEGLYDRPRQDRGHARRHPELIEEAIRLRLEEPARSAGLISEMIRTTHGVTVAPRTLRETSRPAASPGPS